MKIQTSLCALAIATPLLAGCQFPSKITSDTLHRRLCTDCTHIEERPHRQPRTDGQIGYDRGFVSYENFLGLNGYRQDARLGKEEYDGEGVSVGGPLKALAVFMRDFSLENFDGPVYDWTVEIDKTAKQIDEFRKVKLPNGWKGRVKIKSDEIKISFYREF